MTDDLQKLIGNMVNWTNYTIISLMEEYGFSKPFIFDRGTEDVLYSSSIKLCNYTREKDIPATFISQSGNYDSDYWKHSLEHHFLYFQQHLK